MRDKQYWPVEISCEDASQTDLDPDRHHASKPDQSSNNTVSGNTHGEQAQAARADHPHSPILQASEV